MRREQGRDPTTDWRSRREGPSGKVVGAGIAAVLLLVFILQNGEDSSVDFLFWGGVIPLWSVIVVAALLGFSIGWLLGRGNGKRSIRRKVDES